MAVLAEADKASAPLEITNRKLRNSMWVFLMAGEMKRRGNTQWVR
jgi:hypothetical protein